MQTFTTEDADRLLDLADAFLENWAMSAVESGKPDADYEKRQDEWEGICPLLVQAPALFKALEAWAFADADPEAARRKGYYDDARRDRDEVLRHLGSKAVRP